MSAPPVHLPSRVLAQESPVRPPAGGAVRGPRSPAHRRPEDLEGPRVEGRHPRLSVLPAGTICNVLEMQRL